MDFSGQQDFEAFQTEGDMKASADKIKCHFSTLII